MNRTSAVFFPDTRIAVIRAGWHAEIVAQAVHALQAELARQGLPPDRVDTLEVPGAFEIPLLAQRIARRGRHAAIVACGLVVDGGSTATTSWPAPSSMA